MEMAVRTFAYIVADVVPVREGVFPTYALCGIRIGGKRCGKP
jgi:hypothetical protein